MEHLTEEQLLGYLFDRAALGVEEREHITACLICQRELKRLQVIGQELVIARRSQPTWETLAGYRRLFSEVQPAPSPSFLSGILTTLRMTLSLDSRQQAAALGLRRASGSNYRLLFRAEQAEVELMIELYASTRRVLGEILTSDSELGTGPALVQLQPAGVLALDSSVREYLVESDPHGRFAILGVEPGRYNLLITPVDGPFLEVEEIDIT